MPRCRQVATRQDDGDENDEARSKSETQDDEVRGRR